MWGSEHGGLTHVVIVAHGGPECLSFLDGDHDGDDLASLLEGASPSCAPKYFMSLACKTGRAGFGKAFSGGAACGHFSGPHQSVHGAVALQYAQVYFSSLLLAGLKPGRARKRAQDSLPPGNHFLEWSAGSRTA